MPNRLAISICCAAGLLATAAAAQPAKPAQSTIVAPVTVQGATPKTIAAQSRAFVQGTATAPNPELGQISRWHQPVCVQVEGLAQAAQAREIKARIEGVAQAVGLKAPWGGANCKANVEIVFSDDPQRVMDYVAEHREPLLGYYHRHDHDRLKIVSHPIQAWYQTETRGSGGNAILAFADLGVWKNNLGEQAFPGRTTGNLRTDDPDQGTPTGCGDSPHFTSCLTSEFKNVFIVADGKALRDKNLGLAAEYLTMLALSQPKSLDGCTPLPSIIDALAKSACPGRDAPDGLTPADAAWLTALYASDGEAKGDGEKSEIALRMTRMLIKNSAPAGPGK